MEERIVRRSATTLLLLAACCVVGRADQRTVQVCVHDPAGLAVADAQIRVARAAASSDGSGCARLSFDSGEQTAVEITHDGFANVSQPVGTAAQLTVVMQPAERREVIEVTAARTPLALDATASSVLTLTKTQIEEAPGLTLDDKLRQVAGFQLFRRTSSWVANPTTEGTSLRGLGSTAASRTLVLNDQVPLNDAFGGWIHWDEIPEMALSGIELMRGGASDLYGSSAIGGVIDVTTVKPTLNAIGVDIGGGSHGTFDNNFLGMGSVGQTHALAAATIFQTDGYILVAPAVRGPVDIPSNVHSQSGRIELRQDFGSDLGLFLRGNVLNEARSNGTPLTPNGTRLWRYAGGGDWALPHSGRIMLRLYGTDQNYRQNFSSVATGRASEKLTNIQHVPTQQLGGMVQWAQSFKTLTFVAGGDLIDTRATDNETKVVNNVNQPTISISARQRIGGIYGEVLWQPKNWSIAFSSRGDRFQSIDARQATAGVTTLLPATNEYVFDPRLGIVRKLGSGVSLTASGFRAFRGPSMNELYRTGQVGQQTTLANPSLKSERATGFEVGTLLTRSHLGSLRTSYFWTQVNRPIAALTISTTPTAQTLIRQNLGQLVSKGVTVEGEAKLLPWLQVTAGYQYANSTVTKFQADPTLVGKWTAQVARNLTTAQIRMERSKLGILSLDLRASGQQFDDSANQFRLASYVQGDIYAEHDFRWLRAYCSVQNVTGATVEAGRTPILTLGIPRTVTVGIRVGTGGIFGHTQ
jgi:outer membrane receptor protein involved in Fe transport